MNRSQRRQQASQDRVAARSPQKQRPPIPPTKGKGDIMDVARQYSIRFTSTPTPDGGFKYDFFPQTPAQINAFESAMNYFFKTPPIKNRCVRPIPPGAVWLTFCRSCNARMIANHGEINLCGNCLNG